MAAWSKRVLYCKLSQEFVVVRFLTSGLSLESDEEFLSIFGPFEDLGCWVFGLSAPFVFILPLSSEFFRTESFFDSFFGRRLLRLEVLACFNWLPLWLFFSLVSCSNFFISCTSCKAVVSPDPDATPDLRSEVYRPFEFFRLWVFEFLLIKADILTVVFSESWALSGWGFGLNTLCSLKFSFSPVSHYNLGEFLCSSMSLLSMFMPVDEILIVSEPIRSLAIMKYGSSISLLSSMIYISGSPLVFSFGRWN